MGRRSFSYHGNFSTVTCQLRDFRIDFICDKIAANLVPNANEMVNSSKNVRKQVFFEKKVCIFRKKIHFSKIGKSSNAFSNENRQKKRKF